MFFNEYPSAMNYLAYITDSRSVKSPQEMEFVRRFFRYPSTIEYLRSHMDPRTATPQQIQYLMDIELRLIHLKEDICNCLMLQQGCSFIYHIVFLLL